MLLRLLRTYLGRYRWLIALILILQAIQSAAALVLPRLNAEIIDRGIARNDSAYIWSQGAAMLGFTLLQVVASIGAVYFGSKVAAGSVRDIRRDLFDGVLQFSNREVASFGPPSLITRVTNDTTQIQTFAVMLLTMLVATPITAVGGMIMAVREDRFLPRILLVSVPVLAIIMGFSMTRLVPLFRSMQDRIDAINGVLREQLSGIRVVRAFSREPVEVERFRTVNHDLTAVGLSAGRVQAFVMPIFLFVFNLSTSAVIWLAAGRIDRGEMGIGSMFAFFSYLIQVLLAVMFLSFMATMIPRASVSAERILDVLRSEPSVRIAATAQALPRAGAATTVEFDEVTFTYAGAEAPVLRSLSFTARAGQTTAIIGSTGSGKSTILGLVPRLFDTTGGSVLVNGVDVRELDPESLWAEISIVPQRSFLFSGTIASNMRFAAPLATDEEIWEALTIAQADDFVRAMDGQLLAGVAQGGANLSGGQRQRLAIARAVIRRAAIYLFDDSFSALDLATDARLRAALAPWTAQAVVILVAQRVATIRNADHILVIEDGELVGAGSYDELLVSCATFAEIVDSQLSIDEQDLEAVGDE